MTIEKERTFGGKRFRLATSTYIKGRAIETANRIRKQGFNARILKSKATDRGEKTPYRLYRVYRSVAKSRRGKPTRHRARGKQPINPMNTRSNKELLNGHAILHAWMRNGNTDWTKTQIRQEHARLVRIMRKRGIKHNTPVKFNQRAWRGR